jgi:hypothetical protein
VGTNPPLLRRSLRGFHVSRAGARGCARACARVRSLQGKSKKQTRIELGDEQFMLWRRSYDVPPPPIEPGAPGAAQTDPRYRDLAAAAASIEGVRAQGTAPGREAVARR